MSVETIFYAVSPEQGTALESAAKNDSRVDVSMANDGGSLIVAKSAGALFAFGTRYQAELIKIKQEVAG